MEATAEQTAERVKTPTIPVLMQEKYAGYKIAPLWTCEKSGARYFRVTRYGRNADDSPCIVRSVFVKLHNGIITER